MRSTVLVTLVLVAAAVLALPARQSAPAAAQQPQPPITFRVEVNYVEIDATVTDASGNFVRGLTKDDFEILEDRKPQDVSVFSLVDLPVERADPPLFARASIDPDVRTNANGFNGRVFVIVLDDLQTLPQRTALVRAAARQFVDRFAGANDLIAIVHTGGSVSGAQDFTTSRRLLDRAIDGFVGRKLRSATLEKIDDYNRMRMMGMRGTPKDSSEMHRAYNARGTLATLQNVADYMAGIRGRRKAVLYFGEGIDYDITNAFDNPSASDILQSTREAIAAATRANVSFYTVDARGLAGLSDEMMELSNLPEDNSLGPQTLQSELRLAQDSLRVLSEQTGGIATVNRNDFSTAFSRIIQDNSSYYVLGYYAASGGREGRFRTVQVRVRRPGLQVRSRRGYLSPDGRARSTTAKTVAPESGTSPELREILNSPVPVSGLGVRVFAAAFKGPASNASVAVTIQLDGTNLRFTPENGIFRDDIEVSMVALDDTGRTRGGGHDVVKLSLRPQTHDRVARDGASIARRVELAPGRYQLRVGARETGAGAAGSVIYDLEVPDFSKGPLAMSGVVLSSDGSHVPSVNPDAELKAVLPGPPAVARVFSPLETLTIFAEVYGNRNDQPHRISIRTTVVSDEGKVVYSTGDERQSAELQGARTGGFGHTVRVPLASLAPGRYVLRVQAESSLGNHPSATRELEFRIQ